MTTQRATDEAEIRRRIDTLAETVRAGDLNGVTSNYAPDIVSYDVAEHLRVVGAEAKGKNWALLFAMLQRPLGYEIRDLEVSVGDDVAFAYSINRVTGTSKDGKKADFPWVRFTACLRKINGSWLIVHDHVSVPSDPVSGRALVDLEP